MKTLSTLLVAIFIALGFNFNLNAQVTVTMPVVGGDPTVSQVADGLVLQKAAYYRCEAQFNRTNRMPCTLQKVAGHWAITQLSINGIDLPIDPAHPLWELPALKGVVTNFYFWVQGYDSSGRQTRFGGFSTKELRPGDDINVIVHLQNVRKTLPYKMPEGQTRENTALQDEAGQEVGWYDADAQEWVTHYDPINPPEKWLVVNTRTGEVIETIPFTNDGPVSPTGNGIALNNQANIPEFALNNKGDSYAQARGLLLDYAGSKFDGKVMVASVSQNSDYVQVYLTGLRSGSVVQVFSYSEGGLLTHIGDWQYNGGEKEGGTLVVNDITGYTDYKFQVIGAVRDSIQGFGVTIYDTTYPWNTSGGGGGGGMGAPIEENVTVAPPEVSISNNSE